MQVGTFLTLIQKRDHLLEQVFYKSFKNGPAANSLNLPSAVQDILYTLVDGYKSTLLAFGKFSVRQRQQSDYKIERLTKVIGDMREGMIQRKAYDKFLQEKMKNIEKDMEKINLSITSFFDGSLLEE